VTNRLRFPLGYHPFSKDSTTTSVFLLGTE